MTELYGGTEDELNVKVNIIAGLVNLHLMMTLQRSSYKMRKRFLDWATVTICTAF